MVGTSLKITDDQKKVKYPRSVAFIISNEFCERFNYYGMRTILVLYLTNKLKYNEETATVLFHAFTMLVYIFPLVGAIVADSWLGKFKTILYLSVVYAIGGVIVSLGAIPTLMLPVKAATIVGLVLIAIGTGGIKPCVSAFGGDQFVLPQQCKQLAAFFSIFYLTINAGSMISTTLTPILRADVHCFNETDCFSLAFGVPALLMLLSVVIFIAGKKLYTIKPPQGNMMLGVAQTISDAISGWRRERKTKPRKHWLDYATDTVGSKMVDDTKCLMKILVLYLPFPVFWALFDQQGSRWTFQATRMDGHMFGMEIKPDQMQVVNPLLICGFIPLFNYIVYPLLAKIGIKRPLQKLTLGGLLAAIAFLLSALVELKLAGSEPAPLDSMTAQLRIYNGMPCRYEFTLDNSGQHGMRKVHSLQPLNMWANLDMPLDQTTMFQIVAESNSDDCPSITGDIKVIPGMATSYFIADDQLHEFADDIKKPKLGNAVVRALINTAHNEAPIVLHDASGNEVNLNPRNVSRLTDVAFGKNQIDIAGTPAAHFETRSGGAYTLLVSGSQRDGYIHNLVEVIPPNSVSMLWQLPQIMVITAAEIMFSITGLEFSFTQAPQSMKSVLQACWLLSVAIGNMLVVVIAELKFFSSQAAEFTLFAGLMIADILIFMWLAMRYQYVDHPVDEDNQSMPPMTQRTTNNTGISNNAYVHTEGKSEA